MLSTGQAALSDLACVVGETEWKQLFLFAPFTPSPGGAKLTPTPPPPDEAMATIVPYKNPPALIGYYLGVFSLIPCVGFILGIPALILGIVGLKKAKAAPGSKGKAHAWTAIILGSLAILIWGALGVVFILSSVSARRH